MRLIRTRSPSAALSLFPWFVPVNQTREQIFLELTHRLTHNPQETFVCIAVENDKIQGFIVAYCRYDDVFLWQARTRSPFDKAHPGSDAEKYNNCALAQLYNWAKDKGFDRIATHSPHKADYLSRQYGFSPTGKELVKEI